jgi:hypothetical protein
MPSSHLTHGDPRLSRFDPLSRIICFDDFDQGLNGWTALVGNYEGSIDTMTRSYARHTQPMLSQMTHWDAGTHGSVDGTYALKIATRPVPGERNVAIKRLTFRKASRIRVETYFAFKPEANELKLSDLDVRSIGLLFDLQDGQQRVMPHLRYLNALDGQRMNRWQFKQHSTPFRAIGSRSETVTHDHLSPQDWEDIPTPARSCATTKFRPRSTGITCASTSTLRACAGWVSSATTRCSTATRSNRSACRPCPICRACSTWRSSASRTRPNALSSIWTVSCFRGSSDMAGMIRNAYTAVLARGEPGRAWCRPSPTRPPGPPRRFFSCA